MKATFVVYNQISVQGSNKIFSKPSVITLEHVERCQMAGEKQVLPLYTWKLITSQVLHTST